MGILPIEGGKVKELIVSCVKMWYAAILVGLALIVTMEAS